MDTCKIAISKYELKAKIPPQDPFWPKFNSSFDNLELEPVDILSAVYTGKSITTQHKDHWRVSTNYLCGQHIGLDFDGGDESSSIDHLVTDRFIFKYASFIYTTMSHTQESPRSRVIFVVDAPVMQARNYTLAVSALLWLFGTADRQCKDAVRFFYGSPKCKAEFLDNILPMEVVKKLIANYQASGINEKHQSIKKDYLAPASQQEVAEALKRIPPWQIDYDEWVTILMGIHSQFGEAGYSLATSWGDGKQGEIEKKWKSFKSNGNVAGAVTIASVFGIAKRFGWRKGLDNVV